MTNKWVAACVVLMFANLTYAEEGNKQVKQCPDKSKLMNICGDVSGMSLDHDEESNYVYTYQRKIYEASCADIENDSPAEIVKKVNLMWNLYEKDLKCRSPQFDITDGSIIKFAVKKGFRSFIEDVTLSWKLDLNEVDEIDGMTVLDYTRKEIERNRGNSVEPKLREYYEAFRKAGAKHKSEL